MIWRAAFLWLTSVAVAQAADCQNVAFDGDNFSVCTVDMTRENLRLFLYDDAGDPFSQFSRIDAHLNQSGDKLGFAMNAGMYHEDRAPVGHYVEDGVEKMRVIPNAGPGNFGLLPNGILCLREGRADVFETLRFQREAPACQHATQSGPMLVIDGALHPRFLADGTSRYIRNGVGTSADGKTAMFVISNGAINFYKFASFFRDHLKLPQALFLDGNVSRLHAPDLKRSDFGRRLGPIIGTVVPDK
ncbi:MAG: phosphodiester glycosidase family protein [Ascidiaceihabitans sp.]|nr:phosphodiester glycosidase family protein [Ascidiaceihabitans sp.]